MVPDLSLCQYCLSAPLHHSSSSVYLLIHSSPVVYILDLHHITTYPFYFHLLIFTKSL
jgi:hypothetical protein